MVWIKSSTTEHRIKQWVYAADIRTSDEVGKSSNLLAKVEPDDLSKFGLIPEFIGRLPAIAVLAPLDEETLMDILTRPKKCDYKTIPKSFFSYEGVELKFTNKSFAGDCSTGFET